MREETGGGWDDWRAVSMKQLESAFSELLCYAASFGAAKCFNCLRVYKKYVSREMNALCEVMLRFETDCYF